MTTTIERIETLLRESFSPDSLTIHDDSHLHAGHAGARQGGGHYRVDIVSSAFAGKSTVARHRMIYAALGELMPAAIHALAIKAGTPDNL